MGKLIFFFITTFATLEIALAGACGYNYGKGIECTKKIKGKTYLYSCPQQNPINKCADLANMYFKNLENQLIQAQTQQFSGANSGSKDSGSSPDTSATGSVLGQVTQMAGMAGTTQNSDEKKLEESGNTKQPEKSNTGEGTTTGNGNATAVTSGQGANFGGYFKNSEAGIKACEESWSSLFGQSCNIDNNEALKAGQNAFASGGEMSADAVSSHMQTAKDQIELAKKANNSMNLAKSQCSGSLYSCGGICKSAKNAAKEELEICNKDASAFAAQTCFGDLSCFDQKVIEFKQQCNAQAQGYYKRAESAVTKCKLAGAAFLAIIIGGVIALKKHKEKSKKLENEVSVDGNSEPQTTAAQQEEIVWSNGRHQVVSSSKTNSTNSASGSGVSLGESGSTNSAQSNSRKIADPNPNSDLNFKGYDPNQEYSANASSAGTNKLGTNNNAATATGQKIMGTQQAAGASASGVSGGSNSANSELAAYMPGGSRDPAAAMNAAQVRAYNEARKQIRFPHSPSNFKAVQSAYEREKNRMGMNSLGVGN